LRLPGPGVEVELDGMESAFADAEIVVVLLPQRLPFLDFHLGVCEFDLGTADDAGEVLETVTPAWEEGYFLKGFPETVFHIRLQYSLVVTF
jgi:hypothetical protein